MIGIGEISEKSIEVGIEIGKFAQRREGFGDALTPPFTLEAADLVVPKPESEGKPRSRAESTAKTRRDRILGSVEAKLPCEAGVGASDRLAGLEQRAGSVEEFGADQEMRNVTELGLSRGQALLQRVPV